MEIAILISLIILCVLIVVFGVLLILKVSKNKENQKEIDENVLESHIANNISTKINDSLNQLKESLANNFTGNREEIDKQMSNLTLVLKEANEAMNSSLITNSNSFLEVKKDFGTLQGKLASFESLNTGINELNTVLSGSKSKGDFGESSLEDLLSDVFGEPSSLNIRYETQKELVSKNDDGSSLRPDAAINLSKEKKVCIDSKLPFENYKNWVLEQDEIKKAKFRKDFITDLNKQVDEASKYNNKKETTDYSLLYLAFDSMFYFVQSKCYNDVVKRANSKHVLIVSPSTILPILYNIKYTQDKEITIANLSSIYDGIRKFQDALARLDSSLSDYEKQFKIIENRFLEIQRSSKNATNSAKKILENAPKEINIETDQPIE